MTSVTIGIPFRNDRRTLPLAIRSVFAQDYNDWELILVDDGSTDGSLEVARSIIDRRVRVMSDGTNLGLPVRLNQIAREAAGHYLARMDADDAMHPSRIGRQVRALDSESLVQVVASRAYVLDSEGVVRGQYQERDLPVRPADCLRNGIITHPTVMGRTSWFLAHPYDARFRKGQDKELWCRAFVPTAFIKLTEPLLFYRTVGNVPFRKYWQTRRYDRLVARMYARQFVGRPSALRMMMATALKQWLFAALTLTSHQTYLSSRLCLPLPPSDLQALQTIVDHISALPVPGM